MTASPLKKTAINMMRPVSGGSVARARITNIVTHRAGIPKIGKILPSSCISKPSCAPYIRRRKKTFRQFCVPDEIKKIIFFRFTRAWGELKLLTGIDENLVVYCDFGTFESWDAGMHRSSKRCVMPTALEREAAHKPRLYCQAIAMRNIEASTVTKRVEQEGACRAVIIQKYK